jgi:hypothetical protein
VPHSLVPSLAYGTHVLPLQHPFGQDLASQVHAYWFADPEFTHSVPVAHVEHRAPPLPQAAGSSVVMQVPPTVAVQQPVGQVVASQTHWPCALHSWFAPQAAHTPPLAPQAVTPGVVTHDPLAQHPAHAPPPQLHPPLTQA